MNHDDASPPCSDSQGDVQNIPSTIEGLNATVNNPTSQNDSSQNEEKWPQRVEAMCAIILVVITGFYTYYAAKQREAMLKSNDINREALESVQRAFVNFRQITPRKIAERTKAGDLFYWDFKVTWENSGTTPAIGVMQQFTIAELTNEPNDERFKWNPRFPPTITTIGPRGFQDSGTIRKPESFIFGDQIKKVPLNRRYTSKSSRKLFFWGWVVYRDVFPSTKPHLTQFCHLLASSSLQVSKKTEDSISFSFSACQKHNCVDNYCEDYQSISAAAPARR